MKIETFKQSVRNAFLYAEKEGFSVDATEWANGEGINVIITSGKECAIRGTLCLRWEEWDAVACAVSALRVPE